MFKQGAKPGSAKWNEVLEQFLALGFTFVPTFTIYDANRDLMRARQADWHKEYTWKSMGLLHPQRGGAWLHWYRWSTQNEIEWKENYRLWMAFINEYKNRGGRVCTGATPVSSIKYSASASSASSSSCRRRASIRSRSSVRRRRRARPRAASRTIWESLEVGKYADLLVHDHNPLSDFKLLYGTGAMRLNEATNRVEWHRGLKYTIKDGVIFDTAELLCRRPRAGQGNVGGRCPGALPATARGGAVSGCRGKPIRRAGISSSRRVPRIGKDHPAARFSRSFPGCRHRRDRERGGEIGLDGAILRESGAGTPIAMLSNGCICCQAGSDLAHTVDALLAVERPGAQGPLRRIVLETSGLSKPGPVLRQLASPRRAPREGERGVHVRCHLRDAAGGIRGSGRAKWAAAHRIVVTKGPTRCPEGALARSRDEAQALNPLAEIVATASRDAAVAAAFAPLARGGDAGPAARRHRGPASAHRRAACAASRCPGLRRSGRLVDNLAGALGDRLLRLKGLIRVVESPRPVLVQSVGTAFSPPRPFGTPESDMPLFLVIIAATSRDGELEAVQPADLFAVTSPTTPKNRRSRRIAPIRRCRLDVMPRAECGRRTT